MALLSPRRVSAFATPFLAVSLAVSAVVACGDGPGAKDPSTVGAPSADPSATASAAPSATVAPSATASATATATGTTKTDPPPAPLDIPKTKASAMLGDLKAAGLDPANLPPLAKLTPEQTRKVMSSFTKALGTDCKGCHNGPKFDSPTPNKEIAEKMWDRWVRTLTKDGQTLYCDSCHQGKKEFLGHPDHKALGGWMHENFVDGVGRRDGKTQDCNFCHGTPFAGEFLDSWKK